MKEFLTKIKNGILDFYEKVAEKDVERQHKKNAKLFQKWANDLEEASKRNWK